MTTSIIGQIIDGTDVEVAVTNTLQTWLPTYLGELERQKGRTPGTLPMVRAWTTHADFDKWPEESLPTVVVVSPGLGSEPTKLNGTYRAEWIIGLGIVVAGPNRPASHALAKLYCAAARAALLQHPSLDGFSTGLVWTGESYDDLPDESRTLAAGQVIFRVQVEGVTDPAGAPLIVAPAPDSPPAEWPTVATAEDVDVDIVKETQ